ncbi:MAG: right-handed parallel beta-helix repeat-containing protein [Planctomycetota bacterium]|jgi:hypothetical protein
MKIRKNLTKWFVSSVFLLAIWNAIAAGQFIMYVDENATGANDGSSWEDAYIHLQDALNYAQMVAVIAEIRVADGNYAPDEASYANITPGDREATFTLVNNVALKGGYAGFDSNNPDFDPNTRDPNLYVTTLTGDLDENDISGTDPCDLRTEPSRAENSYHIVTSSQTDGTAILDGFIITGGNANAPYDQGAGLYNSSGNPTLINCKFVRNSSISNGGGMYNYSSNPTLTDCKFSGNSAESGGGLYNDMGSPILTKCIFGGNWARNGGGMYNTSYSNPILTDCLFSGNSAFYMGGGMYNYYRAVGSYKSYPTLTNCTFSENSAGAGGGGMYNCEAVNATLINCTFTGNSADDGGGIYNELSSPTLTNCTFVGNSANNGGGINNFSFNPIFIGCTFNGNTAGNGGGMYSSYSTIGSYKSNLVLTNCTFSGNLAWDGGGLFLYNNVNATLLNCVFIENRADYGSALSCFLRSTAATLSNCILWNGWDQIFNPDNTVSITYSDVQFGWPGEGNIRENPLFADPGYWDPNGTLEDPNDDLWVDGDYHLKSRAGRWEPESQTWVQDDVNSPCIDKGDPNTCIGLEPNPNGDIINMGAYGGTEEASLSPSGIECFPADDPNYNEWIQVGAPACWCHERQCHGDTDCKAQGKNKYWVSTNDLDVLIAAWNKPFPEIRGKKFNGVPLICADFSHISAGKKKYRVSYDDLDILVEYWNTENKPDPNCP